jgi:hypothetical protein
VVLVRHYLLREVLANHHAPLLLFVVSAMTTTWIGGLKFLTTRAGWWGRAAVSYPLLFIPALPANAKHRVLPGVSWE